MIHQFARIRRTIAGACVIGTLWPASAIPSNGGALSADATRPAGGGRFVADLPLVVRRIDLAVRDTGGGDTPVHVHSTLFVSAATDSGPRTASLRLGPGQSARNFSVRLDGVAAPIEPDSLVPDSVGPSFRWSVPFAGGEERRVEIEYDLAWTLTARSPYEMRVDCEVAPDSTRGLVREVAIEFRSAHPIPLPAIAARPVPYSYAPDSLDWRLGDVTPATRVSIAYAPRVASQYAEKFLAPVRVTNLDYPWDTQLVSFPEAISGATLDSAWSAADSLRIGRAVDQLHDSAREARRVRKLIADDRSDRLLLPIERLNVGYCRALIDAVEDNRDPRKMRAALAQVRTRYW